MRSHLLRLPDELIEQIDQARGDIPRNTWIRRAVETRLGSPVQATPKAEGRLRPAHEGTAGRDALARQAKLNEGKYG